MGFNSGFEGLTHYIQQNVSLEVYSLLANQEKSSHFRNPTFYVLSYKSPHLVPIPSQRNVADIVISYKVIRRQFTSSM